MRTLAIETSTPRGGVALFHDSDALFDQSFTADRSHSSELFAVIERALAGDTPPGQIVVGLGPGSYAGVRIAIAAAVGLAVSTGADLIGIPSIAALAEGEYLAIGDARRGGFSFAHLREGEILDGPMILSREELQTRISGTPLPVFSSEALPIHGVAVIFPGAARLARLAIRGRAIWSRNALEPIYLREPHITTPRP